MDTFMKTYKEKIKKRKGKKFRGILVYYKKELKNNLTFLEKSSKNILWVKIVKGYLYIGQKSLPSRSI